MMSIAKERIQKSIDKLSPEGLEMVAEFIEDLLTRESEDATEELLQIPDFVDSFNRGRQQVEEGKVRNWRGIRDDV
jgi:hypothetical protein